VRAHWALLPYEATRRRHGLPVQPSNWTLRAGIAARRSLRRISRSTPLDAVFFHTQVPATLCPDWVRRVPAVVSLDATPRQYDDLGAWYGHDRGPQLVERMKWRAARRRFADAAHLVTWSDWAKRDLVDGYEVPEDKVTVVPPGVPVSEWTAPDRHRTTGSPVRLLFVGGDFERKGGRVLLEAFRAIRHLDVELHVVTGAAVEPEPGLHLHHGLRPNSAELRRLYCDSDVFVLPTIGDCLPMVLSEAAAAGLPAVSTTVAAIPEVVVHGRTGLLVPPDDREALGDALHRLVQRPCERLQMGRAARRHVERRYDTARTAPELLEILKHVAARGER
jgi:glycosyltransferase involved in cell wall biosynthesis